jgi:hypothetical protein
MRRNMGLEVLTGRRSGGWKLGLAGFAMGTVLLASGAQADDSAPQPGARAVRLSSVDGTVHISQGGQVLADAAVGNTPLFEGTQVVTGEDGRAEVQYEDGSVARLSPNSSLTLTVLRGQGGTGEAEVTLDAGLAYFELQGGTQDGTLRVRFSDATVTANGAAVLRVDLDNPPGELADFSGNVHLTRGDAVALDLHGGESVALIGADPSHYNLTESIEPDSWDTWNSDRDQTLSGEASTKTGATSGFADNSNPAWNDLDANGNWYNVPGQGYIWSPYEASDASWDPYGNGNWVYTIGFGYVWASGYGWGYLPYQCGTWNYFDAFGWGWEPGLSGCQPWWGIGFYGGPFIGSRFGGYRPPLRPRRPRGVMSMGGRTVYPMIAVNRRFPSGVTTLPPRDRTSVVEIAGRSVQAVRPLSPRPEYDHSASGFVNRTMYPGGTTVSGGARAGAPVYGVGHVGTTTAPRGPVSTPHPAAPTHSAGGGGSAAHASAGGGGGGGSHGGGGGGGGGAHH